MADQNPDVTSEPLNVFSATEAFEGLLSADPEYSEPEENETPAKRPTDDVEGEDAEEVKPTEEETEQPPEEEGDPDDAENEPDDSEALQMVTVTIDGKTVEVPLEEAVKGYSRTQDYTRKTQALAEERKKFQAELQSVQGERQQYSTYLSQLKTALETSAGKEPNWDKLREENPEAFATAWADWQRHQKRLEAVESERQKTFEKIVEGERVRLAELAKDEREKLFVALPEWKDSAVATKEKAALVKYGTEVIGFTEDELNQVVDHRAIVALRKAMLFDEAQKKKAAARPVIEKRTVVAKPGPATRRKPHTELTKAKIRLAKTGSKQAAAAVFEQFLD